MTTDQAADDTGHIAAECTNPECYGCMFCDGGLWGCTVCGGLEGGMPSTCPGESMTAEQTGAVYAGTLDYRDGRWFEGMASRFCPKGLWEVDRCTCTDSAWSWIGTCPPREHQEYFLCPRRRAGATR